MMTDAKMATRRKSAFLAGSTGLFAEMCNLLLLSGTGESVAFLGY